MGLTAAIGYTLYSAYKGATAKTPSLPDQPAQQAAKTPDAGSVAGAQAGAGQAGGSPGVAQTFLTGPGGINPSLLNLGKATLLGG